jgi:hypothetical protein
MEGEHWHVIAEWRLNGFRDLERSKRNDDAVTWVRGLVPESERAELLEGFYSRRAWSLLWDAVPAAEEPKQSDWVWLLRAGAAAADVPTRAARRAGLMEHFRDARPGNGTHAIGRYLMGLDDRTAMMKAATSPDDRCRAAYFLGVEQIAAGRYEDASDWFRLVSATCFWGEQWRPANLAFETRSRWAFYYGNLAAAAQKKDW